MRAISWFFTIATLVLLVALFFKNELIPVALLSSVLAAWTDSIACDLELAEFRAGKVKP